MKYLSIDIETTGLDPDTCDTVEIGLVFDDTSKPLESAPRMSVLLFRDTWRGTPYCFKLHQALWQEMLESEGPGTFHATERPDLVTRFHARAEYAMDCIEYWLNEFVDGKLTPAGKNFWGFDARFLRRLEKGDKLMRRLRHRSLDPGSMLVGAGDADVPDSKECMVRCGIPGHVVHTALEDAMAVCRMVRYGLGR